jgi:hypothetical protein
MIQPTPAAQTRSLTVVTAAHNVGNYIVDAVRSVLTQRYIDAIDLIVVDDGSTDSTSEKLRGLLEEDGGAHLRVIRQANRGVSEARNTALAQVRTEYVGFLDGDDVYMPNFSAMVVPLLITHRWDIIEYNITIIDDDDRILGSLDIVAPSNAGHRLVDEVTRMEFARTFQTFAWARVYKTASFAGQAFPPNRHYEDAALVPNLYLRARNVYGLTDRLVGYRRRAGSITQRATLKDVRDLHLTGNEALARCDGGIHDGFWLTVYCKAFQRACHVAARVDHTSFEAAMTVVRQMAFRIQAVRWCRPPLDQRGGMSLGHYELKVRLDRNVFFAKRLVKKLLHRELHRRDSRAVPR